MLKFNTYGIILKYKFMYKNKKFKKGGRNSKGTYDVRGSAKQRGRSSQRSKFSTKKKLALCLTALIVLVGAGLSGWVLLKNDGSVQLSQAEQREVEQADSDRAKKDAEEDRLVISGDPLKDGQNGGGEAVKPPSGGEAVMSAPTFEQAGGVVKSSVAISGVTGGSCEFNFSTEADRPVVRSAELASGSCAVSIPEVEFARLGEWQLVVKYEGKSVNRKVQIN